MKIYLYNNDNKLKLLYTQNENKASYNGASLKELSPGERDKYCSNILALYDQHFTDSCWSRLDVACFTVRPLFCYNSFFIYTSVFT